ncbi:hypothetical protein RND71_008122 [Anisodus tanguticus]|uniref:Uncharacterized protein n=1 Tax=Anisodus tanguticus TaxID=243964 RepID=A0AAE1SNJ7_9SOLA|nr:hypothetical protein RND71_008122 [Anisodus tanguticus]
MASLHENVVYICHEQALLAISYVPLPISRMVKFSNIKPFVPQTKIDIIAVGPEMYMKLVPAMRTLLYQSAIKVSTPNALGLLSKCDFPSMAKFRPEWDYSILVPMLQFLRQTKAPFMVNPYPYFGYDPQRVDFFGLPKPALPQPQPQPRGPRYPTKPIPKPPAKPGPRLPAQPIPKPAAALGKKFCMRKANATDAQLQANLNWACTNQGPGCDSGKILVTIRIMARVELFVSWIFVGRNTIAQYRKMRYTGKSCLKDRVSSLDSANHTSSL